jgi:hypothetical protein
VLPCCGAQRMRGDVNREKKKRIRLHTLHSNTLPLLFFPMNRLALHYRAHVEAENKSLYLLLFPPELPISLLT